MSGTWSNGGSESGSWAATLASGTVTTISTPTTTTSTTSTTITANGLRESATQVNCYDADPGTPGDYFQCTADVEDASGLPQAMVPSGTVQFVLNPGGGGAFQNYTTCDLAPSQTGGPSGFCSVYYFPPPSGIPIGSQPPIMATYSGDSVFASSTGQPQTLQGLEAILCEGAYDLDCSGLMSLPPALADACVSLTGCLPGAQNDASEDATVDPDENSLVKGDASCPASKAGFVITACEVDAYLNGTASQDVIDKIQYSLNYNTYDTQVTAAQAAQLQSVQSDIQKWEDSVSSDVGSATTLNTLNLLWTSQIKKAYDAADAAGTDTSNVSVTLNDAWCSNFQDPPACQAFVADVQKSVNDSLSALASSKAMLGVNVPLKSSSTTTTKGPLLLTQAARSVRPRHGRPTVVIASTKKTVTLAPGETKTIYLTIPAFVRVELKRALSKRHRTLRCHLVLELATSNGSYTTRTIPVKLYLTNAKRKHRSPLG